MHLFNALAPTTKFYVPLLSPSGIVLTQSFVIHITPRDRMDETYQAKLSGSPPRPPGQAQPTTDERGDIHIRPHPLPHHPPTQAQPVPVQLPNIYVNPFPQQHQHQNDQGERPPGHTPGVHRPSTTMRLGPFKFARPHPLLWISLALSLIALVLEVPKGSLPTLTGRHRALRTQERLVQERLNLLTRLSTFLPPPLANMLEPNPNHHLVHSPTVHPNSLELLKFWNANANANSFNFVGQSGGDRWWSVEELGDGASVVKSRGDGSVDREVWVLRVGSEDESGGGGPLMNALTHSLLLRDRLLSELAHLRASQTSSSALSTSTAAVAAHPYVHDDAEAHEHRAERRRREREREKEVEERERDVGRREKWVIEEMRKLTDKVHAEASELTLEDRITERLKAYQRQLGRITEEREKEL